MGPRWTKDLHVNSGREGFNSPRKTFRWWRTGFQFHSTANLWQWYTEKFLKTRVDDHQVGRSLKKIHPAAKVYHWIMQRNSLVKNIWGVIYKIYTGKKWTNLIPPVVNIKRRVEKSCSHSLFFRKRILYGCWMFSFYLLFPWILYGKCVNLHFMTFCGGFLWNLSGGVVEKKSPDRYDPQVCFTAMYVPSDFSSPTPKKVWKKTHN